MDTPKKKIRLGDLPEWIYPSNLFRNTIGLKPFQHSENVLDAYKFLEVSQSLNLNETARKRIRRTYGATQSTLSFSQEDDGDSGRSGSDSDEEEDWRDKIILLEERFIPPQSMRVQNEEDAIRLLDVTDSWDYPQVVLTDLFNWIHRRKDTNPTSIERLLGHNKTYNVDIRCLSYGGSPQEVFSRATSFFDKYDFEHDSDDEDLVNTMDAPAIFAMIWALDRRTVFPKQTLSKHAAMHGSLGVLSALLYARVPFHPDVAITICANGHVHLLSLLTRFEFDIPQQCMEKAVRNSEQSMIEALLKHGLQIQANDVKFAIVRGKSDFVIWLLSLEKCCPLESSWLEESIKKNKFQITKWLIEHGLKPTQQCMKKVLHVSSGIKLVKLVFATLAADPDMEHLFTKVPIGDQIVKKALIEEGDFRNICTNSAICRYILDSHNPLITQDTILFFLETLQYNDPRVEALLPTLLDRVDTKLTPNQFIHCLKHNMMIVRMVGEKTTFDFHNIAKRYNYRFLFGKSNQKLEKMVYILSHGFHVHREYIPTILIPDLTSQENVELFKTLMTTYGSNFEGNTLFTIERYYDKDNIELELEMLDNPFLTDELFEMIKQWWNTTLDVSVIERLIAQKRWSWIEYFFRRPDTTFYSKFVDFCLKRTEPEMTSLILNNVKKVIIQYNGRTLRQYISERLSKCSNLLMICKFYEPSGFLEWSLNQKNIQSVAFWGEFLYKLWDLSRLQQLMTRYSKFAPEFLKQYLQNIRNHLPQQARVEPIEWLLATYPGLTITKEIIDCAVKFPKNESFFMIMVRRAPLTIWTDSNCGERPYWENALRSLMRANQYTSFCQFVDFLREHELLVHGKFKLPPVSFLDEAFDKTDGYVQKLLEHTVCKELSLSTQVKQLWYKLYTTNAPLLMKRALACGIPFCFPKTSCDFIPIPFPSPHNYPFLFPRLNLLSKAGLTPTHFRPFFNGSDLFRMFCAKNLKQYHTSLLTQLDLSVKVLTTFFKLVAYHGDSQCPKEEPKNRWSQSSTLPIVPIFFLESALKHYLKKGGTQEELVSILGTYSGTGYKAVTYLLEQLDVKAVLPFMKKQIDRKVPWKTIKLFVCKSTLRPIVEYYLDKSFEASDASYSRKRHKQNARKKFIEEALEKRMQHDQELEKQGIVCHTINTQAINDALERRFEAEYKKPEQDLGTLYPYDHVYGIDLACRTIFDEKPADKSFQIWMIHLFCRIQDPVLANEFWCDWWKTGGNHFSSDKILWEPECQELALEKLETCLSSVHSSLVPVLTFIASGLVWNSSSIRNMITQISKTTYTTKEWKHGGKVFCSVLLNKLKSKWDLRKDSVHRTAILQIVDHALAQGCIEFYYMCWENGVCNFYDDVPKLNKIFITTPLKQSLLKVVEGKANSILRGTGRYRDRNGYYKSRRYMLNLYAT